MGKQGAQGVHASDFIRKLADFVPFDVWDTQRDKGAQQTRWGGEESSKQ